MLYLSFLRGRKLRFHLRDSLLRRCYAGKNRSKGCDGVKKQIRCLLLALCGLTACGAQAEEIPTPRKSVRQEDQAPVRAAEDVPPADTRLWNLDRKPYGDWVFKPEPYLVTMEAYGDLCSRKESYMMKIARRDTGGRIMSPEIPPWTTPSTRLENRWRSPWRCCPAIPAKRRTSISRKSAWASTAICPKASDRIKTAPGPKTQGRFLTDMESAAIIVVAAAAIAAATPAAIAAANPDDDQQDDDPAAVATAKAVIAHTGTSYEVLTAEAVSTHHMRSHPPRS